jgi:hypothetical protein
MINFVAATLLLLLCLGISVFFVWEASDRTITSVEGILFQVFALATGLIGSFIFGRQSARTAAREMIKPHARSAFRRLTSLYVGLSDIARVIEAARNLRSNDDQRLALAKLEGLVLGLVATADDALEDWRDIVPEDVEDLPRRLSTIGHDGG